MGVATDWGAAGIAERERNRVARLAAPPLGVLVLIAIVMGSIFVGTWGIVVGAVMIGCVIGWVLDQPRRSLLKVGAEVLDPSRYPRVTNVVEGLAQRIGTPPPELYLISEGPPNALTSTRHGGAIALTRSLLEEYSRTELEAVLAHCLVRLRSGAIQRATTRIAFGPLGRALIERVGIADDVAAAAATRYPPALVAAIEKAEPHGGRFAALWFLPAPPFGRMVSERTAALSDL